MIVKNLEMFVGDGRSWTGVCLVNGSPFDVSGYDVIFTLRGPSSNLRVALTKPNGGADGLVKLGPLARSDTNTVALNGGRFSYDVVIENPVTGEHVATCQFGNFILNAHPNP